MNILPKADLYVLDMVDWKQRHREEVLERREMVWFGVIQRFRL
jgi:hypothetical protein